VAVSSGPPKFQANNSFSILARYSILIDIYFGSVDRTSKVMQPSSVVRHKMRHSLIFLGPYTESFFVQCLGAEDSLASYSRD